MRSLLFVPGDSESKLAKAGATGADVLILDLEDSVAPERKAVARAAVCEYLSGRSSQPTGADGDLGAGSGQPRLFVRINDIHGPHWDHDLAAVVAAAPDGLVLPKPRSGEDVHRLSVAVHMAEDRAGLKPGRLGLIAIVTETPQSLLALASYAGCSSRLMGLAWGAEDLSAALGSMATRDEAGRLTSPFRLARDLTLVAAAAAEVTAIDGIWGDIRDAEGLARETRAALRDGFAAKLAIHPDQVAVINEAFTPTAADLAHAEAVVRAFAQAPGAGVVTLGGTMLDRPHLARAQRVLSRAAGARAAASGLSRPSG